MKCYIANTLEGLFALDEGGNIVNFRDFNNDYQKLIKFYESVESGIVLREYEDFLLELKNSGFDEYIFDDEDLESFTSQNLDFRTNLERFSLEFKNFRFNLEDQLNQIGLSKKRNDILAKYKKINEELIKKEVSKAAGQIDVIITQVIKHLILLKNQ